MNERDKLRSVVENNTYAYTILERYGSEHLFDLCVEADRILYAIATYSTKTNKLTIIYPDILIPSTNILSGFVQSVKKEENLWVIFMNSL